MDLPKITQSLCEHEPHSCPKALRPYPRLILLACSVCLEKKSGGRLSLGSMFSVALPGTGNLGQGEEGIATLSLYNGRALSPTKTYTVS